MAWTTIASAARVAPSLIAGPATALRIVGEDEADPSRGTISYVSPVARALVGKKIGDVVRAGKSDVELVAIT